MFTTGIRTNPSNIPKTASRKAVTSQTIAPGVLSPDTVANNVMVSRQRFDLNGEAKAARTKQNSASIVQ
jgi:hypothetical protein